MRKITLSLAALLAAAAMTLTACSKTGSAAPADAAIKEASKTDSIVVQSSQEVKFVPDMAQISFAILTQQENPQACQAQNSEDLNQVITFLKEAGIDQKSIQTSNYGLNPIYDWSAGQEITGYEMRTELTVSDLPIERAGELLSSCVEAGINGIDSVTYSSSQYDTSYEEALKMAVEAAKAKAETIASASGRSVGKVIRVEEAASNSDARYTGYSADLGVEAKAVDSQISVEPGQLSVTAQVSVEFEMK